MATIIAINEARQQADRREAATRYLIAVLCQQDASAFVSAVCEVANAHGLEALADLLGREVLAADSKSLIEFLAPCGQPDREAVKTLLRALGVNFDMKLLALLDTLDERIR